jgi:hypothetical protein
MQFSKYFYVLMEEGTPIGIFNTRTEAWKYVEEMREQGDIAPSCDIYIEQVSFFE